jgi:hypothetical protein
MTAPRHEPPPAPQQMHAAGPEKRAAESTAHPPGAAPDHPGHDDHAGEEPGYGHGV